MTLTEEARHNPDVGSDDALDFEGIGPWGWLSFLGVAALVLWLVATF